MPDSKVDKQKLAKLGRNLTLLLNRATMYKADHPYINQSIDAVYKAIDPILTSVTPLVFILNGEQFYIDKESLDPRLNVTRTLSHFKQTGIQSISFDRGLDKNALKVFLEVFSSLNKYPDAEAMKRALTAKNIIHLKINHVFFKKVTEDDEVVSRDAFKKAASQAMEKPQLKSKDVITDALLQSVLTEEYSKTVNIGSLMKNPAGLSKNMIDADLAKSRESESEIQQPGPVLLHQLEMIDKEVDKSLTGDEDVNLSQLANAVFDMKKQLLDGITAQKAAGIAYPHEEMIVKKTSEIGDKVIIRLIKEEYQAGKISTVRLAQILRRLVPEADELRRLLPKIKRALLKEGMPLSEYLNLMQELSSELQSEGLVKILKESSQEIGIDGEGLIQEFKENPVQAAELMYLASEIRKGTGDEKVLTEVLVDYVERLGLKTTVDMAKEDGVEGEEHLRQVMTGVKSNILRQIGNMDVTEDVLAGLEEKLQERMDEMVENLSGQLFRPQSESLEKTRPIPLSVLETLERNVSEKGELGEILKIVRSKVESKKIDENDFKQIHNEIERQKQRKKDKKDKKKLPPRVVKPERLMFFLEKEIARVRRYDTPFTILAFSVLKAKAKSPSSSVPVTKEALMDAVLHKLSDIFRETDIVTQFEQNNIVAFLPMTPQKEGKQALRRVLRLLNLESIKVNGIPIAFKIVGVANFADRDHIPDAKTVVKTLYTELRYMVARIKNIHELF